jgi:hypothetical protein
MKMTESYTESNCPSVIKDSSQRNSGYFPLLKFKENLYNTCQSKFSEFINNKRSDLKLIINNKINQQISINDYINNTTNDTGSEKLTPIPIINKRKIKNEGEKKELKKFQRNVVLMRRLEYANKMKEKSLKKKYNNKIKHIIKIQKMVRGYLVRKVINQVNIINDTIMNFSYLISLCIKKKYFNFLKNNILKILAQKVNDEELADKKVRQDSYSNTNFNLNTNNETNTKNDFYNNENDTKINQITKNEEEENDLLENSKNGNQILKEVVKITDKNINNINEINKEEININLNNKFANEYNFNNKPNIINNYNYKNLNENYTNKEIGSNSLLNDQLNEIKNTNKDDNNYIIQSNNKNKIKYNSKIQHDSVIENDDYIDFSGKCSMKKDSKKISLINGNAINNEVKYIPNRNPLNIILSDISNKNIRKAKTETIQRQFRKYLTKKGYYGKFDKRKIAIVYLLKNILLYNIKLYVFNIIKLMYRDIKNITITQEDNFFNLTSERIENIKHNYNAASNYINHN